MAGKTRAVILSVLVVASGCVSPDPRPDGALELTWAESPAPTVSRTEFGKMMQAVSNWGRWGPDDQLGTLNLITPSKRRSAAGLVREGITVSMALEIDKQRSELNRFPVEHEVQTVELGGHAWAVDRYTVLFHGYSYSHIDGLQHVAHDGSFYNGMPIDSLGADGAARLGIQHIGARGIFTRGVLIDLPKFFGVDYLPAGTAISAADLEAWEKATGISVGSGDVLLIRTGRWAQVASEGTWDVSKQAAGLHASVAGWLRARDIAAIGCDGVTDVLPSGVEGLSNPLHELIIAGMGMPMLDNLDLDAVAEIAAEMNRSEFLFVASPIRFPGGTGALLNPLAVF